MAHHSYQIGKELLTQLRNIIAVGAAEQSWQVPEVVFRRRKSGSGRDDVKMRLSEGITLVPTGSADSGGTSERDDWGVRFLVGISFSTTSDILDDAAFWPTAFYEQIIRQRFQQRRVNDICNANFCEMGCTVLTGANPDWLDLKDGIDETAMFITVFIRESRRLQP